MKKNRVLVVATSRKTRGGITAVIKAYESTQMWKDYHCRWIGTHRDSNAVVKIIYFVQAFFKFICFVPFYEIVHFHVSDPTTIKRKALFIGISKMLRKKIIVHFHSPSPDLSIKSTSQKLYHWAFRLSDYVVALSPAWKRNIEQQFHDLSNIRVVYNPCNAQVLENIYSKKKHILYAGTINSRKGYQDLIRAFGMIANDYTDWTLVLAGNGEIEQGKALAEELCISNQVRFLGWVNGAGKDKAFKEASIFCLPSYAEGFPMAVLDAFSYGLPVVTTPVGGIPDIAEDGDNMLLFIPGDTMTLAAKLQYLITHEDLQKKLAEKSKELAHTTFSLNLISNQISDLYDSLYING